MSHEKKKQWRPNEEQLRQAEALATCGSTEKEIALIIGISESTLQFTQKKDDALRQAILKGRASANAKVGQSLFKMATSQQCPAASIFWAKVRMRWKETDKIEIEDKTKPIEESQEEKQQRIDDKLSKLKLLLQE